MPYNDINDYYTVEILVILIIITMYYYYGSDYFHFFTVSMRLFV